MQDLLDLLSDTNPWRGLQWLMLPENKIYVIAFAAFLGSCIGSFLTLVTHRLPLDEKIGMTRSHCPNCSTQLRIRDLVPIFSWVSAGGKCRYCRSKVHIRYPLTELACAIGSALVVWHWGMTLEAFALMGFWWCVVAIVVTDLEYCIILDEVQIAVGLFGALYAYALGRDAMDVAIAAITGGVIGLSLKYGFIYLRNKDGLGLGDVKFLVVAGVWLGTAINFVPFLFFSGVLGIFSGLIWRFFDEEERFPFGPALAFALLLCIIFPDLANGFWTLYGWRHTE